MGRWGAISETWLNRCNEIQGGPLIGMSPIITIIVSFVFLKQRLLITQEIGLGELVNLENREGIWQ